MKNLNEMTPAERVEYCVATKNPICADYFANGALVMPFVEIPDLDVSPEDTDAYFHAIYDADGNMRPEMIELAWKNDNTLTPEIVLKTIR